MILFDCSLTLYPKTPRRIRHLLVLLAMHFAHGFYGGNIVDLLSFDKENSLKNYGKLGVIL
jgi:hypothetical protein